MVIMKLLTKKIKDKLLKNGLDSQRAEVKFFNPCGSGTWVVSGMDKNEDTMWCLADIGAGCCEQGTVSLAELKSVRLQFGLKIERDLHFNPRGKELKDYADGYEKDGTLAGC